jgi:hypothetical protein
MVHGLRRPSAPAQWANSLMTIVVTAKVTDGIVLAADSAASFFAAGGTPLKIYNNANKIFNLVNLISLGFSWNMNGARIRA